MAKRKGVDSAFINADDWDAIQRQTENYEVSKRSDDSAGMTAAHDAAEKIRAKYGYSGGVDGTQYEKLEDAAYTYPSAPRYEHTGRAEPLYTELGDDSFEKYLKSDEYDELARGYHAAGERAMSDTLGKLAKQTGGMASSYAATAAAEEYGDYLSALHETARARYEDTQDERRANAALLQRADDADFEHYETELSQYNRDRTQDYAASRDRAADEAAAEKSAYQKSRDEAADARYTDETSYDRARDEKKDALDADETSYHRARDERKDALEAENTAYERAQDVGASAIAKVRLLLQGKNYAALQRLGFSAAEIDALRGVGA